MNTAKRAVAALLISKNGRVSPPPAGVRPADGVEASAENKTLNAKPSYRCAGLAAPSRPSTQPKTSAASVFLPHRSPLPRILSRLRSVHKIGASPLSANSDALGQRMVRYQLRW